MYEYMYINIQTYIYVNVYIYHAHTYYHARVCVHAYECIDMTLYVIVFVRAHICVCIHV